MDENFTDEKMKSDLAVNNLIYKQPLNLSLAKYRTLVRQQFHKSSYSSGETAIVDWNTGAAYVNTFNSYLTFKVALTGTSATANFGVGSALNLISAIRISSRSGTELFSLQRANIYARDELRYKKSIAWVEKYGTLLGMGATGVAGTDPAILSETAVRFAIPLAELASFFDPITKQALPANLASGLQIQLELSDYRTALFAKANTPTGFNITDIAMMCDCITLADETQKSLNYEAASNGLEYTYMRQAVSTQTINSTSIAQQVRAAVGRATSVRSLLIPQANLLNVAVDSIKSGAHNTSEWVYNIGGSHYPNAPIRDSGVDGVESFIIAQNTFNKSRYPDRENSVSLTDFKTNGYGILTAGLETDQQMVLTGESLNNSRSLELVATLASWSANLELITFVDYVTIAKCYVDNCVVSS